MEQEEDVSVDISNGSEQRTKPRGVCLIVLTRNHPRFVPIRCRRPCLFLASFPPIKFT